LHSCYRPRHGTSNKTKKRGGRREKGTATIWSERITTARAGAVSRNLTFEIDAAYIEELFKKQNGKCAISGLPIEMNWKMLNPTASLDRIESHRGYVKGNVQWVHKVVNIMKSNHDEAYFIAMCKKVAEYRGGGDALTPHQEKLLAGQPHRSRDRLTKVRAFEQFQTKKTSKAPDLLSCGGILL
jgi:hypothetical protein